MLKVCISSSITRMRDYEWVYYDLMKYVTEKPSSFNENILSHNNNMLGNHHDFV